MKNYTEKVVSGRYFLNSKEGNVEYIGTEVKTPVKYFLCNVENGILRKKDFEEARLIRVDTFVENEGIDIDEEIDYKKVIEEFGDKKAKDRIKKRELEGTISGSQKIKYTANDAFFEVVGKEAELENLFEKEYVDKSKELVNVFDSEEVYTKICKKLGLPSVSDVSHGDERLFFTKKCLLTLMDFVFGILDRDFLDKSKIPQKYSTFFQIIKKDIFKNKLTKYGKDKLVSKLYMMMLMYCNGEINIDILPRFKYPKAKFITLIKALNCAVDRKGNVKFK